jgi:hypothetical protein
MSRVSAAASTAAPTARKAPRPRGYFAQAELPWISLIFVAPLIVLYEVGTYWFASDPVRQTEQRIIAFNLMQDFFRLFGASGRYLPALAVGLILLCWHLARRDPWRIEPTYLLGMAGECILLAVPLVGVGFAATHYLEQLLPLAAPAHRTASLVVLSLGAGVYEELVFRLIAFTALSFLLIDVFGMRKTPAGLLMVVLSSFAFSVYHYLGPERFDARTFTFRTAAGAYFGAVFLFRGFGITAGTHATYDLFIVLLRTLL